MNYRECNILQCEPTEVDGCWYMLAEGALDCGPPLIAFQERVERAISDGARWIIFDCHKMKSFFDLGNSLMVSLADDLERTGGGAILLQMSSQERVTFRGMQIENNFHFVETMEEALTIARETPPRSG